MQMMQSVINITKCRLFQAELLVLVSCDGLHSLSDFLGTQARGEAVLFECLKPASD